ncbi:MAG: TonB family protein [Betaproteobacteria bacterium]|nr:MAG: TonB family protein [Betaproteobacteria bacterium]
MSLPFIGADVRVSDRLLAITLAASIFLHAVVLAVKFSPFDLSALDRSGPPLEVALVNAKSKTKPTKAEILAQHNLVPVLPQESANNELAVATQRAETLERETKEMMTQLRAAAAVAPPLPNPTEVPDPPMLPTASEIMQRTLEAVRLEAQIAKEMDAYAKRPKRRFVGARAAEYRFARYVEDWRLKVERVGNLNYPEAARTQKLYGSLLLTVGIRADGSIESVIIDRGSGQKILDLAATKIVEMASPYAAFPPDIKRDTDILYVTRTWTFGPGDSLTSQ